MKSQSFELSSSSSLTPMQQFLQSDERIIDQNIQSLVQKIDLTKQSILQERHARIMISLDISHLETSKFQ